VRGPRLLLVLLLLTAFTLTALDARSGAGGPFDALRRGVDTVLGPAQRAPGGAVSRVAGAFDGESEPDERLREENARLQAELRRTEDLRRRVRELDELLRLGDAGSYPMVPARVTARGSAFGFESTVTLDAGSSDGIAPGQTVVDGDGLLGRTVRVGPFTSTVLLLTDPGFTVGARLDRAGTIGLATGTGDGLEFALVEGGRLQEGDGLLTTGSDTFVPGVPVGRVTAVETGRVVSTAQVEPFVDVSALDLVGVVTAPPRSTPRVPLEPSPQP
jgi:rod shape-determining protein MreC